MEVIYDPAHRGHAVATEIAWGASVPAYESPERAEIIRQALLDDGGFVCSSPTDHGRDRITAVHDPGLVRFLERAWRDFQQVEARSEVFPDTVLHGGLRTGMGPAPEPESVEAALGYWSFETMTPVTEGSFDAAVSSVNVALSAWERVRNGDRAAYGLCRPPGHHATTALYGGYCFFNNAAIVAQAHLDTGGGRVTVLDVDYHHGNGTQQIFYARDDVQFVSLHADPHRAYPYFCGHADETGTGRGLGSTLNTALGAGIDDDRYLEALAPALEAIDRFDPDLLVVSLGVDTFDGDPIGDFKISTDGMGRVGHAVGQLSRPSVILQEGGYHLGALGVNVAGWLVGFERSAGLRPA